VSYVIEIVGLADGTPTIATGTYVEDYTPDGNDGQGELLLTARPELAKLYDDPMDALAEWKRVSTTHPTRPDGKPNRPLTAFTVTVVKR
jgi:hypothetical protein